MLTLKAEKRNPDEKAKKLRRDGFITGVLYGKEMKENVSLKFTEKQATAILDMRLYKLIGLEIDALMNLLVEEGVKIVFTSAGNPKTWTGFLKGHGIKVAHVVSSSKFAVKCEQAGVDALVAEGFEAGGHNGRDETTTLCLIPAVRRATTLPLMAAGGIGTGSAMLATFALGAEGVQIGTRFALTEESSAHENFKQLCLNLNEGDTKLLLKKLSPTRLVKGEFTTAVEEAEARGASVEEMKELLGKGRAKKGIFEGNLQEGELEIGQVASLFRETQTVTEVMKEIIEDFRKGTEKIQQAL